MASGCAFALTLLVARTFTQEQAGIFFTLLSGVFIASAIARVGIDNPILKHVSVQALASHERAWYIVKVSLVLVSASSCLLIGFIWIFAESISVGLLQVNNTESLLKLVAVEIWVFSTLVVATHALEATNNYRFAILGNVILTPLITMSFILGGVVGTLPQLIAIHLIAMSFSALLSITAFIWLTGVANKLGRNTVIDSEKRELKAPLWASAKPLWLSVVATKTTLWSGQLVISVFEGPEDVAMFTVCLRVALFSSFILTAVNHVAAPRFAKAFESGDVGSLRRLAKAYSWIAIIISSPFFVIALVWPNEILAIFGLKYANGASILQILAIGQFVNTCTGSVGYLLTMTGQEKDMRNVAILMLPITVMLLITLTIYSGILGAAIAAAICVGLRNLFLRHLVKKRLDIKIPI